MRRPAVALDADADHGRLSGSAPLLGAGTMADHHDHDHYKEFDYDRVTSPMQEVTSGQATTGAVVALVGVLVVFGLPLLLV